jgi:DNA repair protein RadA/Sms
MDSIILIGGEPGAGKSTLSLQACSTIAESRRTLYIATEESRGQIKGRAKRIKVQNQNNIRLLFPNSISEVEAMLREMQPQAIILDSLPGLVSEDDKKAVQICTMLKHYAKDNGAPSIIIDHITKDGDLAGLMKLQHVVDVVATFRPQPNGRVFRAEKNRHGIAFLETWLDMQETGLAIMTNEQKTRCTCCGKPL